MKVLVGYATCHGSTRSIAERIAGRLEAAGHAVDCLAMAPGIPSGGYDAAVLGSAVHSRTWLAEGTDFLSRVGPSLAARPVWLFSVGMPAALSPRLWGWAVQEKALVESELDPLVKSRDHELFSGVIHRSHLDRRGRAAFRLMGGQYGDFRDWDAVDEWAAAIARALGSESAQPLAG